MKTWFSWFFYVSLLFALIGLFSADYLVLPRIQSNTALVASLAMLFAGFLSDALAWQRLLQKTGYDSNLYDGICSTGLSIFAKYIPGKIWVIVGRAAYISAKTGQPMTALSALALRAQCIQLWLGLMLGALGLPMVGGLGLWGGVFGCAWIGLTIVIFSKPAHELAQNAIQALVRRPLLIPSLSARDTVAIMPWFLLPWLLWSAGLYLLAHSLISGPIAPSTGLAFPLSASLGIMAIIAPGGLGVREGVMAGYLASAGMTLADASAVAVAARLWFLLGEIFIFGVAWFLDRR